MKKKFYLTLLGIFASINISVFGQLPTGFSNIDINNIDAGISSSSDLFWDFTYPKFEVPKGSGKNPIFTGGIWIGGTDAGGQIHMGAQTYRQTGNDFYPGPIDTAAGTPSNWIQWDRSWKLNKTEITDHISNYTNVNYVVPTNIADWPGYDTAVGRVLAPFADYNGNGIYDPANGDYPYILGDQSVYSIFNDLSIHTESNCLSIGIEVHRTMFGFDEPLNNALNNSIFSRYEIKNYSLTDYHDVYITVWTDFDLGNPFDDLCGTDINLNLMYCYNGDNDDETAYGYGINPPAMGVYFLNDTLSSSIVYDNVNGVPTGNPGGCDDFYNYATGVWLNNMPITYGGNGQLPGNPSTTYMYPGTTDPVYFPTLGEWSEITAGNLPEDRRMFGSIGPFNLVAGAYKSIDVGYTWSRATSGGAMASLAQLQIDVASLRLMYNNGTLTSVPSLAYSNSKSFSIFPNPSSDLVNINLNGIDKSYDLIVKDAIGKIVYSKINLTEANHKIDVSDFSKGIYVISVLHTTNISSRKLIVK